MKLKDNVSSNLNVKTRRTGYHFPAKDKAMQPLDAHDAFGSQMLSIGLRDRFCGNFNKVAKYHVT